MKDQQIDEMYVLEILHSLPPAAKRDRNAFVRETQPDIRAGYAAEVKEAEKRLFGGGK